MSAGHLSDLSILFMQIQNLVTILGNFCKSRHRMTLHRINIMNYDVSRVETGVCRQHYSMNNRLITGVILVATLFYNGRRCVRID